VFDRRRLTLTRVLAVIAILVCVAGGALTLAMQPAMVDLENPASSGRALGRRRAGVPCERVRARRAHVDLRPLSATEPRCSRRGAAPHVRDRARIAATVGAGAWLLRRLGGSVGGRARGARKGTLPRRPSARPLEAGFPDRPSRACMASVSAPPATHTRMAMTASTR